MKLTSLRGSLTYCSVLALSLAAFTAAGAFAQEASTDTSTPTKATDEAAPDTTEIVVTGSRIRNRGAQAATPTQVVTSAEIRQTGTRQMADLVNQLPQLVISQSDQTSNANRDKDSLDGSHPGLNALDLRGLGIKRTLTLVNGRRHVPGAPGTSAVDVSTIPAGLVDRVEVITGGASALYGADAVAGVANFILKKNYQGFESTVRYGNTSRNDNATYDVDALYGKNFNGGKGNFTVFGSYSESTGIVAGGDRPWTAGGYPYWAKVDGTDLNYILDGRHSIYNDLVSANVLLGGKVWGFTPTGGLRTPDLGPGLLPTTADLSLPASIGGLETGGGEYGGRYDGWLLTVPSKRFTAHASFGYQITPDINYFLELDYASNKSTSQAGPFTDFGQGFVSADSPFITDEMRAANGGSITTDLNFVRRYPEFGIPESKYTRDMTQVVTGLDGQLPSLLWGHDWSWSTYYSYGKTSETAQDINATSFPRYTRALDSVMGPSGTPVCRVNLTDPSNPCVPLNPFQTVGQDVIDYLQFTTDPSESSLQQHVFSAYMTGGLFTLPAGEVDLVIGGEYRKEINDIGAVPQYDPSNPAYVEDYDTIQNPLHGEYDVKEAFAELNVPILANLPFAYKLSVDAAARSADYSTAGHTFSYKYGLQYAPVRDFRLRATYGVAVRAPDISEAFTASSHSGSYLTDPCNYYNLPFRTDKTQYTAANCAQVNPANFNTYWIWTDIDKRGNPDLKVETGKTLTVGLVAQPRFMKNFTASFDYYDIDLTNVVSTVLPQTILNKCVDSPTLDNSYCALVVREPGTNNLTGIISQNINLAERATSGLDINFDYFVDLAAWGWGPKSGRLSINSTYTHLYNNDYTADPDNPQIITKTAGVFGFPKWKGVTRFGYANGPLNVTWNLRHFAGMKGGVTITPETYTPYETKDAFYSDLYGSYKLSETLTVNVGLYNAFDLAPPRYPGAEAGGAYFGDEGWQAGTYDVMGRTGFISLTYKR